ncbi:MAG: 16S rRNA (guanine(527)-N(7))-methyltransferase RsmG [Alphaproteobacteria bacterium]|nr:16S rRNA (guanine(527)-N(7))-methyltransferase RsmG [Alphaproteobacteria bacterium]
MSAYTSGGSGLDALLKELLGPHGVAAGDHVPILAALAEYGDLLRRWNTIKNLVSRETLADLERRHLADSLQLMDFLGPEDRRILDLGSGAGLPGIPIAIAVGSCQVTLVEANGRKAAFLRQVARQLNLDLQVQHCRIEKFVWPHGAAPEILVSRAFARLPALLLAAERFFGSDTRALFHKGRDYAQEIAESGEKWRYDVQIHRSRVAPDAVILEISGLSRR